MNKKAYYFTIDAFIALIIILGVVLFLVPEKKEVRYESFLQEDLLKALSTVKIGEIDNSVANSLRTIGAIKNPNQSTLQQIGEFYAELDENDTRLAQSILDYLNLKENIALYFENNLIANSSVVPFSNATDISTSRYLISGIQNATAATGFSARAHLFTENKVEYFYFGGYVGDGNISANFNGNIIGGKIEGDFSDNFTLFINNFGFGPYSPTPGEPYELPFDSSMISSFNSGINLIEFKSADPLFIAGGFIKVIYNSTSTPENNRYHKLPGIEGMINLYDGFYIPGQLTGMNASLHFNSSRDIFFTIGNKTVYEGNSSTTDTTITISNSSFASNFSFSDLSEKTIPYRIGIRNASYVVNLTLNTDIFSVTDLSGSMDYGCDSSCSDGLACGCGDTDCPICNAKTATFALINGILNNTNNSLGLVGYSYGAYDDDFHELSNNNNSLRNLVINQWEADGGTAICRGINRATRSFKDLLVYYDFNSNINDQSSLNHLSSSSAPNYVAGIEGEAIDFDGTDYVQADNYLLADKGTIAFWFRPDNTFNSASAVTQGLWSKYYNNDYNAFIALRGDDMDNGDASTGEIQFKIEDRFGSEYAHTTTNNWVAGQWHHIAMTWDGRYIYVYVDGVLEDSEGYFGSLSIGEGYRGGLDFNGIHNFGRSVFDGGNLDTGNNGDPRYFDGRMDEVRFFNRDLTQEEISDLMDSENCGDGKLEEGEVCDEGVDNDKNSICSTSCTFTDRHKTMVVMSDGAATWNYHCPEQNTGLGADDAIQAACDAYDKYGIVVHAVEFGTGADNDTLNDIRNCGNGEFYSGDVNNIVEIYNTISQDVISAAYTEQTLIYDGIYSKLFPDSYIHFDYVKDNPQGMVITAETPEFGASAPRGSVLLPNDVGIYEVRVVSYSGSKWTSRVEVNNSLLGDWEIIYDLGDYNSSFLELGDPYVVNIPTDKLTLGNNSVDVAIGLSTANYTDGSEHNKIIYSIIKNVSSYSPVVTAAQGCNWTIEFEDNSVGSFLVPTNYSGPNKCFFNNSIGSSDEYVEFNRNDAIQYAIFLLLQDLDLNTNGKVEVRFNENDLSFTSSQISGIPFTWDTEVQTRVWI